MMCPCRGCKDRHANCHSECEAYKTWRIPLDGLRAEQARLRKVDEVIQAGKERRRKWSRNRGNKR